MPRPYRKSTQADPNSFGQKISEFMQILPQHSPSMEQIIGENLIKGEYNPYAFAEEGLKNYNAALTGYRQTSTGLEQEPGIMRALALIPPAGGGPAGALGAGAKGMRTFGLSDDVVKAFEELGEMQRGAPEAAMLKVQHTMGGGVLNPVVEHIGDLTHRMTHHVKYGTAYWDIVKDKVDRMLRALEHPYGFSREMAENIRNNAAVSKIPVEELTKKIDDALAKYAKEHAKLPVYNNPQYLAREAAVAVGKKDWDGAIMNLRQLRGYLDDPERFNKAATHIIRDNKGNIKRY